MRKSVISIELYRAQPEQLLVGQIAILGGKTEKIIICRKNLKFQYFKNSRKKFLKKREKNRKKFQIKKTKIHKKSPTFFANTENLF
jgi:hypothetical protein